MIVQFIIGLIVETAITLYNAILENLGITVAVTTLCLLICGIYLYKQKQKKNALLAEEELERQKKLAEEAEVIQNRSRIIKEFSKSEDYILVKKYAEKYLPDKYFTTRHIFLEFVKIIQADWSIESEDIGELILKEREVFEYENFVKKLKQYELHTYVDYLRAAINAYGDDIHSVIVKLYFYLRENELLPSQSDKDQIIHDINNLLAIIRKENIRKSLLAETNQFSLSHIDLMNPYDFETYIAHIFSAQGYSAKVTKASGDQGADIVMEKLGEKIVVQVKLYSRPVGNKAVQEVVAAKSYYDASRAMIVTNNYFTTSAIRLAKPNKVELINRDSLEKILRSI